MKDACVGPAHQPGHQTLTGGRKEGKERGQILIVPGEFTDATRDL